MDKPEKKNSSKEQVILDWCANKPDASKKEVTADNEMNRVAKLIALNKMLGINDSFSSKK